jgi:hypothetical protein
MEKAGFSREISPLIEGGERSVADCPLTIRALHAKITG